MIGGALIAWGSRRWRYAVPFVLLVPLKLSVEWLFLKQVVERERPYVTVGADIEVRGTPIEGLGFPSGHTTTAFAFAVLVVAFLPARWRPVPVLLAIVVGVSRLYAGAHNVLDVVAGAAVGVVFGSVLWFAVLDRLVDDDEREPV
jgi:membrane-associated phospholipid phosphatase